MRKAFRQGRLWIKLFLSFTLIILVCGGLILGIITCRISDQFKAYVQNGDVVAARALGPFIGRLYENGDTWEDSLNLFSSGEVRMGNRAGGGGMMGMNPERGRLPLDVKRRIVITDLDNRVFADSADELTGQVLDFPEEQKGILIFVHQEPLGRLYVDSMIDPALNPLGRAFLKSVWSAVIAAVLPALLLAVAVTFLIVRHITSPLNNMKTAAIRLSNGDLTARTGVNRRDELGELAQAFDDMASSLEAGEEWKRRIIADAAHELRTPVALLQGNLEMMSDGVYPLEISRIKSLYEETRLLTGLISDLQELAGLEAGRRELSFSTVELDTLARDVADTFQPVLQETGGQLVIRGTEIPAVPGNYIRLKQVFINLFSNAARYIPPAGSIEVDIFHDDKKGEVRVEISNNGPSIPPEDLEKIFERFYRVEKSRNRDAGGRGLGLAIVGEIIKAHGGRIHAENLSENRGVKFAFSVPV